MSIFYLSILHRKCTWIFRLSTQPENIGRQSIPRTSPSTVSRTSPKDPIWPSRGLPKLTFWGRLEITSRGRPNLTSKGRPWEVHSGCLQDVLKTSLRWPSKHVLGTMWVHLLDVLKFFLLFFQNLFNWQNLSKSNSILKVY